MMDVENLLINLLLIAISVVAHCYIAYMIAPKKAMRVVESWFSSKAGVEKLLNYLIEVWDKPIKDGKSVGDIVADKIQTKLIAYTKTQEAIDAMNGFIEVLSKTIQDKISKWAGGKISGMKNQINSGQNQAEMDIAGLVKSLIIQKIAGALAGNPILNQMLPQPPPSGGQ